MKRLITILFLLTLSLPVYADRITALITVTNNPSDGDTITVNGVVRTWKTTVATPATQIAITNTVNNGATNLFNQITANPYAGPLAPVFTATNGVSLLANSGNALVVTASGTWANITTTTQTVTSLIAVRVPISGEPTASVRTNIASALVQAESDYSTNTFSAGAIALTNHVNRTTAQTISGAKTFTGTISATNTTNVFAGNGAGLTNVHALDSTNGAFTIHGDTDTATFLVLSSPGALGSTNVIASNPSGVGIGAIFITSSGINGVAGPNLTSLSTTNLVGVIPQANFGAGLTATNFTTTGTIVLAGNIQFPSTNVTSLANGGNAAIPTGANVNIFISGPSAAFSTDGIAGGANGRVICLASRVGQTWTIPNESGFEGTPANRIQTGTGATVTLTNNPACANFFYDATAQRWILGPHSN